MTVLGGVDHAADVEPPPLRPRPSTRWFLWRVLASLLVSAVLLATALTEQPLFGSLQERWEEVSNFRVAAILFFGYVTWDSTEPALPRLGKWLGGRRLGRKCDGRSHEELAGVMHQWQARWAGGAGATPRPS
jgi:hypothetical protein